MRNKGGDWGDFEIFENVRAKRTDDSFITIGKYGRATLNAGFLSQNHAKIIGKTHVKLGYSKSKNTIALEFTDDAEDRASLKLTKNKKSNWTFALLTFASNYNLDLEKISGRYQLAFEAIPRWGNYFTVNLDA